MAFPSSTTYPAAGLYPATPAVAGADNARLARVAAGLEVPGVQVKAFRSLAAAGTTGAFVISGAGRTFRWGHELAQSLDSPPVVKTADRAVQAGLTLAGFVEV